MDKNEKKPDSTLSAMEDKTIKTTYKNMSEVIEEKLQQLHDLATMEVMLPTNVRMRNRLESIRKMASAKHHKINGHWKTIAPKIYIMSLEGKKISNTECEIYFSVYETDEKGDKKLYTHYADIELHDGSKIKRPTSAEYRVAYEVVERIKYRQPITRDIIKIENGGI